MITRIEIDGFKTFQDFSVNFSPFQVIIGANGSGKSNLFDAIQLLSRLAEYDVRSAFQDLRGEAYELFTQVTEEQPASRMRFAVEILVDNKIQDSWGIEAKLTYPRLRYELTIVRQKDERGLERLYVEYESLEHIPRKRDDWRRSFIDNTPRGKQFPTIPRGRDTGFITTDSDSGKATIHLHTDGHGGRRASVAEQIERTVLSGVNNTEYPHAFAARQEMRHWTLLQLNPVILRQPGSMDAPMFLGPDGSNLPTALARLRAEDSATLVDVSRDLANIVPGLLGIDLEADEVRKRYVVCARTQAEGRFSSRVLSDGTLRLLALSTLRNDPQHHGVICFEEPENGVHPSRLRPMSCLLRDMTTDFQDTEQADEPLRQLLVNTHSPRFVSQLSIDRGELLFAYTATRVTGGAQPSEMRVTRLSPVGRQVGGSQLALEFNEALYTLQQILDYLDAADIDETRSTVQNIVALRVAV